MEREKSCANTITDGTEYNKRSGTGRIVYMPPDAKDVPSLMQNMEKWTRKAEKEGIPPPIIAALVQLSVL